jgi:spermidine synthase
MVASMAWYIFKDKLGYRYILYITLVSISLIFGFLKADSFTNMMEKKLYQYPIILSKQTPYQKIIITKHRERVQFYINGAIQFDSIDEHRYHESLVHPVMNMAKSHENILIIGGGDGMALREVLKYKDVKKITLVDLDKEITNLFSSNELLKKLNNNSYSSKKLKVINKDAWKFVENANELFDVIIIDLPDPNNISLSRLYSVTFYNILKLHLSKAGALITQATSPMFSKKAFWSIEKSIKSTKLNTIAYHTYLPSFGEWGFVLASKFNRDINLSSLPTNLRYIEKNSMKNMLFFDKDMAKIDVKENKLTSHNLIDYYNKGWDKWYDR